MEERNSCFQWIFISKYMCLKKNTDKKKLLTIISFIVN